MTPLQAAITLAEMHDVAVAVGHDLQLDMAGPVEVLFHVYGVVAKRGLRLGPGNGPGLLQPVGRVRHLHPAPAPAGGGLDQHGVADPLCDGGRLCQVIYRPGRSRD